MNKDIFNDQFKTMKNYIMFEITHKGEISNAI